MWGVYFYGSQVKLKAQKEMKVDDSIYGSRRKHFCLGCCVCTIIILRPHFLIYSFNNHQIYKSTKKLLNIN